MKNKETDIELIEQYLEGKLSEKAQAEFKKRLQNDPDFSQLYQFRIKFAQKWNQATEYENTKNRIGQIIAHEKQKKKQNTIYWIAAVLILSIAIPGVIIIDRQNKNERLAESEENQLQMHIPEYNAAIRYFDENYKQILPQDRQNFKSDKSIIFSWNSELDVRTAIIIKFAQTDSLVWRVPVLSKMKEYELKRELPKGEYAWEMEGFEGKRNFSIE